MVAEEISPVIAHRPCLNVFLPPHLQLLYFNICRKQAPAKCGKAGALNKFGNPVVIIRLRAAVRLYLSLHAKQKAFAKCTGALDVSWPYWKFKLGDYARGTPDAPIAHMGYRHADQ